MRMYNYGSAVKPEREREEGEGEPPAPVVTVRAEDPKVSINHLYITFVFTRFIEGSKASAYKCWTSGLGMNEAPWTVRSDS